MKKTIKTFFGIIIITVLVVLLFDTVYKFVEYPEMYLSTWKYQLKNDVKAGDPEAIEYYEARYIARGIRLFD